MSVENQSGFDFHAARIIRRRFTPADNVSDEADVTWDVLGAILEVNLYESIFEPVMTGEVALVDSASLGASINFQGQEILNLQWVVGEKVYNKDFYIYSVASQTKDPRSHTSTLVLNIIERHGYLDQFKFLNASSAGDISTVIDDVLQRVGASLTETSPADRTIRILHNNRNPLEIVRWLAKRATNTAGEPMFCYSTLDKSGNLEARTRPIIKFRSLADMMDVYEWNDDERFVYTQVPSGPGEDPFLRDQYKILGIHIPENDNIFKLAQAGAMRSAYYNIDPYTRQVNYSIHDGQTHFEGRRSEIAANEGTQYDTNFYMDEGNADENTVAKLESSFFSGINTTSMFTDGYKGYNEETDPERHAKRIARESDILMMEKQSFTIMVPGYLFGATGLDRGVGTTMEIMIPKDQPSHTPSGNEVDAKRSGRFLIINKRHIMKRVTSEYTLSIDVGRPDTPDNVNDSTRYRSEREQRPR
jgi:hypothetical protein